MSIKSNEAGQNHKDKDYKEKERKAVHLKTTIQIRWQALKNFKLNEQYIVKVNEETMIRN